MNGRTNSSGSILDDLQIPLDPCTSLRAEAGNGEVTLYWDDPVDKYATPEDETAQNPQQLVSVWDHTIVVRKVGSQPANPNDGIIVTSSGVRDQYLSTGYTDASLANDITYYYGVFAVNKDGVASEGTFASATPMSGTPLSELVEGALIKILENGSPVEFYVAKHNYESELNGNGRTLVVSAKSYDRIWDEENNAYASSDIDAWLNGTYKAVFSSYLVSIIGSTQFYYTPGYSGSVKTLSRPIFILSFTELGQDASYARVEGSELPIASTLISIEGTQWTRTPYILSNNHVWRYSEYNNLDDLVNNSYPVFPAFTLPSTALVDQDLNLFES